LPPIIYFILFMFQRRLHGDVVVSTIASQQEDSRFESWLGPFCVEFACSPLVCVGSRWVLQLPPTGQKHTCQVNR